MLGTSKLKWAIAGQPIMQPTLAVRLALALWPKARPGWHRLADTYDTDIYDGDPSRQPDHPRGRPAVPG